MTMTMTTRMMVVVVVVVMKIARLIFVCLCIHHYIAERSKILFCLLLSYFIS